jgi:drug/metabolite transporter (DMT)-like permease
MKARTRGSLFVCYSAVLWGMDGVILTPRLHNLPVPFVVFILHAVPFLLMQPFLSASYRRVFSMGRRGWLSLFLVALTGGLIGTIAIVKALFLVNFSHLSVVVLLQKLQPLFAIVLAAILLGERVSARFLGWALLAILGAYGLTFGLSLPDFGGGATVLHAAGWALLAAAAFGTATVLGKQLLADLDFVDATFARYGMTTLLATIYLAVRGGNLPLGDITPGNCLIILIISLTSGSGAIFLYYNGLRTIPASVATICELCLPLSAVFFDYVANDSVLGPWQWVGATILVGSILRISLNRIE